MNWIALLSNKWVWYGIAAVAVAAATGVVLQNTYVKGYNSGVFAERAGWQKIINRAIEERDRARRELTQLQVQRNSEAEQARRERDRALSQVQQEIRNAESVEDQYALYVNHRRELRDQASANLASARADYLSSIGAAGGSGSGGIRPFDLDPNEFGSGYLCSGARELVGNCLS